MIRTEVVTCSVRCGPMAKAGLAKAAQRVGADWCLAEEFYCKGCGQRWNRRDFSGDDLAKIACSNCYSDEVLIIRAQAEFVNWRAIAAEEQAVVS